MDEAIIRLRGQLTRLFSRFGPDAGREFYEGLLIELNMEAVRTPDELLAVGKALCERSSDVAALGHTVKANALLLGARRPPGRPDSSVFAITWASRVS